MSSTERQGPTAQAAERFFRAYGAHCVSPNEDTLFNLLNAAHSLNDKMRKELKSDFFALSEFVALKALRNLLHHQEELLHEVRIAVAASLPSISTDLMFLCLVPRPLIEMAIAGIPKDRRPADEPLIRGVLKWYGNVVNINPCIFNFAVHVYERMNQLDLVLMSDAYCSLKERYELEEENGYSHFVSGELTCHAGSVDAVLKTVFADVV